MKKIIHVLILSCTIFLFACGSSINVEHNICDGLFSVTKTDTNFKFKQVNCFN